MVSCFFLSETPSVWINCGRNESVSLRYGTFAHLTSFFTYSQKNEGSSAPSVGPTVSKYLNLFGICCMQELRL